MASNDPFPTAKLNVPYLKDVLEHLRDPAPQRLLIILHVKTPEEGDWILANTQARLARTHIAAIVPEMMRIQQVIEKALHTKTPVALVGKIRSADDAHAMRVAAGMGLKLVGYIAVETRAEFDDSVVGLGPWHGVHPYTPQR